MDKFSLTKSYSKLRANHPQQSWKTTLELRIPERILTHYLRLSMRTLLDLHPIENPIFPAPQADKKYSLYIHIPFCETLCPYCSFNRFHFHEDLARNYFRNLRIELDMISKLGYQFETIYIGGGTPTILIDELTDIIELARNIFNSQEVSCETNPNHLVPEIVDKLKERVDRLSVGVQSFNPEILKGLHRLDKFGTPETILERIAFAAPYFSTFNIDMIFNFPGQTETMIMDDIEKIIQSAANQVTFYPLMVSRNIEQSIRTMGKYNPLAEMKLYHIVNQEISRAFEPESVWTFSRKQHTLIDEYISSYEEYIGVGSGAFSYMDGSLFVNTFSLEAYHQALTKRMLPISGYRKFSLPDRMKYRFLMHLFNRQLDKQHFKIDFHVPIDIGLWKEILFMKFWGALHLNENIFNLKPRKQYLIVVIMREFFSSLNRIRDQARQSLPEKERLICKITDI